MDSHLQEEFNFDENNENDDEQLFSRLVLEKPLVLFDLETTGLDIQNDRIVQFAFIRIHPDKTQEEWVDIVNPGMPIPVEASNVHGITDEIVKDKPTFDFFAKKIKEFLHGCDLAGFNVVRFDVPFLQAEMTRHNAPLDLNSMSVVDAQVIFHKQEPRNLTAAFRYYCGAELVDAHDALADIRATLEVLDAQINRYQDLPANVSDLHKYCNTTSDRYVTQDRKFYWRNGEAVISFGKHRSKSLEWLHDNDPDYLMWIKNSDFSDETKMLIDNALNGLYPKKKKTEEDEET